MPIQKLGEELTERPFKGAAFQRLNAGKYLSPQPFILTSPRSHERIVASLGKLLQPLCHRTLLGGHIEYLEGKDGTDFIIA
jgi:hypothetical protein